MAKVKLGDVVVRIKDRVDKDNTDLVYYVGGEHFNNGTLTVKNSGLIKGSTIGPAFCTKFKTGDVLLMSRNPHLRKAGMVDFDGICSDVSYIIRTKDEKVLMQKFIPIIFQSDEFWQFAEKNKKGSTNFFLNWSDFERFEFEMPTIFEQRKYVDLIWAMEDTIESYKRMIAINDDLINAKFISMFSKTNDNSFNKKQWREVVSITNGKSHKNISGSGEFAVYGTGGRMLPAKEYLCDENTIIMGRKGTIDKPYICKEKSWIVDTAFGVNPKDNKLNYIYLFWCIKNIDFTKLNKAAVLPSVTQSDLLNLWIDIPPIALQDEFAKFYNLVEYIKQQILDMTEKVTKMRENAIIEALSVKEGN